jgi:serine/threonine protein kinase
MADQLSREQQLLQAALPIATPEEQLAYLQGACGADVVLLQHVIALLQAHQAKGNAPVEDGTVRSPTPPHLPTSGPLTEKAGDRIERYRLLQEIGEGGCGLVYVAEQEEPVRRRVALKVIKLGMDTRQVIARFDAERQALAMMDHPNIAKVFDAGATETGRPFFVMELVRGVPITEYCDKNKLSTRERLDLFVQVCRAIQHAHQKGVIHRDIKPSNILVTLHDGVPVPKVIDFGIAKATQGRLTGQTIYTAFEQFIGTPAYMSPEQAEMSGLDIDTRSDIYALGVLLYELLTGRTPFDSKELANLGLDEIRRTIRDREPPRPSTRLSTMVEGDLTTTASQRQTEAPKLIHLLRGDLDWVVMKCLEKDRTRRYETANGLAMDVQRYLSNEPVVARPPSKLYRLQKAVRRNKLAFAAAAAVVMALLLGAGVSILQAVRASRAEAGARRAQQQAEAINRFLTEDLLYQATPDQNAREKNVTMEEVLARAARMLDTDSEIAKRPELEATLRLAIGSTYTKLGLYTDAERHLSRAVDLRRRELGPQNRETLAALKDLVTLQVLSMNRFDDEYERLSLETWQGFQRLLDAQPSHAVDLRLYRDMLDSESAYTWVLANRGQIEKALPLKRENAVAYERIFGPDDRDSINELHNLAMMYQMHGDSAEAERGFREALKRYSRIGKADSDDALMDTRHLADCRFFQGDSREAEALLEESIPRAIRTLGPENPTTLHLQYMLARVLVDQGRFDEAETLAKENLRLRQHALIAEDGNTACSMLLVARVLVERGKLDEAQSLLQQARTIFREHYAQQLELIARVENVLGALQLSRGNYPEAESLLLPLAKQFLTPISSMSPHERSEAVSHIVKLYQLWGKPEQAATWQHKLDEISQGHTL